MLLSFSTEPWSIPFSTGLVPFKLLFCVCLGCGPSFLSLCAPLRLDPLSGLWGSASLTEVSSSWAFSPFIRSDEFVRPVSVSFPLTTEKSCNLETPLLLSEFFAAGESLPTSVPSASFPSIIARFSFSLGPFSERSFSRGPFLPLSVTPLEGPLSFWPPSAPLLPPLLLFLFRGLSSPWSLCSLAWWACACSLLVESDFSDCTSSLPLWECFSFSSCMVSSEICDDRSASLWVSLLSFELPGLVSLEYGCRRWLPLLGFLFDWLLSLPSFLGFLFDWFLSLPSCWGPLASLPLNSLCCGFWLFLGCWLGGCVVCGLGDGAWFWGDVWGAEFGLPFLLSDLDFWPE